MPKLQGILQVNEILNDYCLDIQDGMKEEANALSKQGSAELKNTSPKKTGSYRKGWKIDKRVGNGYAVFTIHNKTDYQLTHLLEKPHLLRNGRSSRPIVHISPVDEKYSNEYEKKVEAIIKNGGQL